MNEALKKLTSNLLADDPEFESRIKLDTERHRKGFASFNLKYADGTPVEDAKITYNLAKHEFQFGCNAFMLNEFDIAEQNAAYEEKFKELFNLAVVPFYWSDLELRDGEVRFDKNSEKVYRRPAPDLVLEFCEKHNITPKGHPLMWQAFFPEWAPRHPRELMNRLDRRFAEIAARYGGKINNFDVINEQLACPPGCPMPPEQIEFCFKLAEKYFPAGTVLNYNETTGNSWERDRRDYTPIDMIAQRLIDRGIRIDCLGLQYHMFHPSPEAMLERDMQYTYYNPAHLFSLMDRHSKLGIPFNVSEITIPGPDIFGGDEMQSEITERLFRIWFSHPSCMGIIWWNLVDGTAAYAPQGTLNGENYYKGGVLNYDFSEKTIYKTMKRLIHDEWHTKGSFDYKNGKINKIHGFHGDYDVTIATERGIFHEKIGLYKDIKNEFFLTLK